MFALGRSGYEVSAVLVAMATNTFISRRMHNSLHSVPCTMTSVVKTLLLSKILQLLKGAWVPEYHLISCLIQKRVWGPHNFLLLINETFLKLFAEKK